MDKYHQDAAWVQHSQIASEPAGEGTVRRILAYSKDAMCVENTFETGGIGAMHCHPHTQITYIVSGRYRFTIGDETREVGPGDTLLKQGGVMHGCVCLESGVMVDFFTPMREDFIG
ncbi:MAG: cupin domain-containing protein [Clostridiales bacterium]|nr:cupin domain-containing protein [Clostridiales bacterium]